MTAAALTARPRVLCVVGPTGAGKSAAALHVAERIALRGGGVIINADSRQVYRDFPVITARPTAADEAWCPHELYGFLATEDSLSAGTWADEALLRVQAAHGAGRLPLLVGGTGLYLRALLDGMVNIPPIPADISAELAVRCATEGSIALHEELGAIDPEYAARIHGNDRQRVVRALEVFRATGKTFTWWHTHTPPPPEWDVLRVGVALPLNELAPRLAARVDAMLEQGAVEEVEAARQHCANAQAPGWSGIGCAELLSHVQGELTLAAAREAWIKNTRAYAKRQLTWFRPDARITWFEPGQEDALWRRVDVWMREE